MVSSVFSRRDALLLLFAALLLRLAAVSALPPAPSERSVFRGGADGPAATAPSALTGTLVRALRPLEPTAPDPSPYADPPPGPWGLRLVFALIGALAATALGAAAGNAGGRAAGWLAGGLLAVAPFAFDASVRVDPAGPLLAATAGSLWLLTLLAGGATVPRSLGAGALTGLAAAASPGAAGLAVGWPVAARGGRWALAIPAAVALFALAAPAAFVELVDPAARGATAAGAAAPGSPLLAGLRTVAGATGVVPFVLALAGVAIALRRGGRTERALLATVGASFLATLLLGARDPARLAVAMPGVLLFAGLALPASLPARVRGAAIALVFVWTFAGTAPKIAGRWTAGPGEKARAWVERSVPPGSPILVEGDIRLGARERQRELRSAVAAGEATTEELAAYTASPLVQPLELPAHGASPDERALFYDPNVAKLFEWILLADRPPDADDHPARFRTWVEAHWDAVGRFGSVDPQRGSFTMFRRPSGFEYEPESALPLVEMLGAPEAIAVRDTSRAFTDWALRSGIMFRAVGQAWPAKGLLRLAAMRDSTNVRAHFELGLVHLILEEDDEAKAAFLAGLDVDPYHGGIHYNLGTLLEKHGDVAGAEVEYLAAIAHLDDPTPAHARLGALLAARGDIAGAQAHLAELVARDPESDAVQFLVEAIAAAQ